MTLGRFDVRQLLAALDRNGVTREEVVNYLFRDVKSFEKIGGLLIAREQTGIPKRRSLQNPECSVDVAVLKEGGIFDAFYLHKDSSWSCGNSVMKDAVWYDIGSET